MEGVAKWKYVDEGSEEEQSDGDENLVGATLELNVPLLIPDSRLHLRSNQNPNLSLKLSQNRSQWTKMDLRSKRKKSSQRLRVPMLGDPKPQLRQ